jgi:hypothetical protein
MQYAADLEKAVSYFETDKSVAVAKEIGSFSGQKTMGKAIKYYNLALKTGSQDDIETNLLCCKRKQS